MSADDFTLIKEAQPGRYIVFRGSGDEDYGRVVFETNDLREACEKAAAEHTEYATYFEFIKPK